MILAVGNGLLIAAQYAAFDACKREETRDAMAERLRRSDDPARRADEQLPAKPLRLPHPRRSGKRAA
jgi:hypothetical protein